MRIALVLLFVAVIQLRAGNGYAQKTKVPISMSQVSVEQVLNRIEETSDFVFLYNDKTIDKNQLQMHQSLVHFAYVIILSFIVTFAPSLFHS